MILLHFIFISDYYMVFYVEEWLRYVRELESDRVVSKWLDYAMNLTSTIIRWVDCNKQTHTEIYTHKYKSWIIKRKEDVELKAKKTCSDRKDYCTVIKGSLNEEDIAILKWTQQITEQCNTWWKTGDTEGKWANPSCSWWLKHCINNWEHSWKSARIKQIHHRSMWSNQSVDHFKKIPSNQSKTYFLQMLVKHVLR